MKNMKTEIIISNSNKSLAYVYIPTCSKVKI